jgi:hypothetical protein
MMVRGRYARSGSYRKAVSFKAIIDAPPNTGKVVSAAWDPEGTGTFSIEKQITESNSSGFGSQVRLNITHTFSKPGTYFPGLLAASQREGMPTRR